MSKHDTGMRRLGWDWLWFFPLCAAVLVFVEGHTAAHAFRLGKLAYQRWLWVALISPSAYFCLCMIAASLTLPLYGLGFVAEIITTDAPMKTEKRYLYAFLLAVVIVLIPHFLFEVWVSGRMIGPTPVLMRLCGAKDTPEAYTQWVNNKTSPFSSLSTPL
jgi:hypothetical protein